MYKLAAILGLLVLSACARVATNDTPPPDAQAQAGAPQTVTPPGGAAPPAAQGLAVTDLKPGSGPAARNGQKLKVKYVGKLADGTVFDSNTNGPPFAFTLGGGQVIQGWDKGLVGMKAGGKRKLTIPPEMGYGTRGAPPKIPPNAKLIFDVELVAIE